MAGLLRALAGALLAATALALVVAWLLHPGWAALLLPLGMVGWWGWRAREAGSDRTVFEREYLASGLEQPVRWTVAAVGQQLERLAEQEAQARLNFLLAVERRRVEERLDQLQRERAALVEEQGRLLSLHGAAPPVAGTAGDGRYVAFLRLANRWQSARRQEAEAAAALAEVERQRAERLAAAGGELARLGLAPATSGAELRAVVEELAEREGRRRAEQAVVYAAEAAAATHEGRAARLRGEAAALFARLGLREGDYAGLSELVALSERFKACREQLQQANGKLGGAGVRLESAGAQIELTKLSAEELTERREQARCLAERADEIVAESSEIEAEIRRAGAEDALTRALAAEEEAREGLRRCCEEDLDRVAAGVLVACLKEEVRRKSRPPVFRRAAELLADFTAGRCRLEMEDGDPPRLLVAEGGLGDLCELNQLSCATRLQLMLAVRLAFVELDEGEGPALPLLLDELLANSDEQRTLAVVGTAAALAAAGRQLFYFTAQRDEVGKWREMCAALSCPAPQVIDLAEVRRLEQCAARPLRAVALPPPPPRPGPGESMVEYGQRLGVMAIDPARESADEVHLWHLVEEPSTIHRLLELGLVTWWHYRNLREHRGDRLLPARAAAAVAAAAAVVEAAARWWRVGRGRPVGRSELREGRVVSDRYLEPVATVAERVGRDPEALLVALRANEVNGFGSKKITALEEWLKTSGFLDSRERVPEAVAYVQVLAEMAGEAAAGTISPQRIAALVAAVYRG